MDNSEDEWEYADFGEDYQFEDDDVNGVEDIDPKLFDTLPEIIKADILYRKTKSFLTERDRSTSSTANDACLQCTIY